MSVKLTSNKFYEKSVRGLRLVARGQTDMAKIVGECFVADAPKLDMRE
jgi:hypothetical protein